MHRLPTFLLVFAFALLANSAHAQTTASSATLSGGERDQRLALAVSDRPITATTPACQIVRGQVLNEDGLPLPGATVMLKGTRLIYSTNSEGFYSFTTNSLALPNLQISYAGYSDVELPVRRCSPETITLALIPGTRVKQGGRNHGKILAVGRN
ncbi:carboxypeptidase-like regulatory domain-containing protein [Hymenobacter koreensis]|uniref:Carboxypeptidase-like regulatory domain-containing protein n=1 Tax=Hymenobacter koreensis TaxID=1084523 RepID=A0ABP8JIM8_9BACT